MIARNVIVIGDVMLDVTVKPLAEIAPTSDTPSRVRISAVEGPPRTWPSRSLAQAIT